MTTRVLHVCTHAPWGERPRFKSNLATECCSTLGQAPYSPSACTSLSLFAFPSSPPSDPGGSRSCSVEPCCPWALPTPSIAYGLKPHTLGSHGLVSVLPWHLAALCPQQMLHALHLQVLLSELEALAVTAGAGGGRSSLVLLEWPALEP